MGRHGCRTPGPASLSSPPSGCICLSPLTSLAQSLVDKEECIGQLRATAMLQNQHCPPPGGLHGSHFTCGSKGLRGPASGCARFHWSPCEPQSGTSLPGLPLEQGGGEGALTPAGPLWPGQSYLPVGSEGHALREAGMIPPGGGGGERQGPGGQATEAPRELLLVLAPLSPSRARGGILDCFREVLGLGSGSEGHLGRAVGNPGGFGLDDVASHSGLASATPGRLSVSPRMLCAWARGVKVDPAIGCS